MSVAILDLLFRMEVKRTLRRRLLGHGMEVRVKPYPEYPEAGCTSAFRPFTVSLHRQTFVIVSEAQEVLSASNRPLTFGRLRTSRLAP